ncbi:hypothetical protein ACYULU_10510 [Breznakiellaceae bacterium SP9]
MSGGKRLYPSPFLDLRIEYGKKPMALGAAYAGRCSDGLGVCCAYCQFVVGAYGVSAIAFGVKAIASAVDAIAFGVKAAPFEVKAIAFGIEAIAFEIKAAPFGVKAIATRVKAIPFGVKGIATRVKAAPFGVKGVVFGEDLCNSVSVFTKFGICYPCVSIKNCLDTLLLSRHL